LIVGIKRLSDFAFLLIFIEVLWDVSKAWYAENKKIKIRSYILLMLEVNLA
jgi:hypothetical protein